MIELKIAEIKEHKKVKENNIGDWKFILAKQDSTILLYAGVVPNHGYTDIVEQNSLSISDVIGGGDLLYVSGELIIKGSIDFGYVPNQIMEEFAEILLKEYGKEYKINKIEVNMDQPDHMEDIYTAFWKLLGYSFDDRKRVLEGVK